MLFIFNLFINNLLNLNTLKYIIIIHVIFSLNINHVYNKYMQQFMLKQ